MSQNYNENLPKKTKPISLNPPVLGKKEYDNPKFGSKISKKTKTIIQKED